MFRDMRRANQLLDNNRAEEILVNGITGILGLIGDNDYPYTVPLNYVYEDGVIYFHGAKSGHKSDAIQKNNKVSFCVIAEDEVVSKEFTTYYRSVIAFGKASEVSDTTEKIRIMRLLNYKYSLGFSEEGDRLIQRDQNSLCITKIQIEHLTGKESMELVKKRK